ncbi:MAG: trimethylamine methyltransferase family protein [Deltaproteobacteria bacterium]|nr:trimethylamine methyltransferase family protein [Deltaproteobacteria bacterium]
MPSQALILSEDERQRVHDESVKVLERVGVKLMSERALKILAANGAVVDTDSRIARMSAEMIDQALKTAPRSFTLGGRTPEYDAPLPSPSSGYVLDLGGVFTRDFRTGERRYATLQDNEDAVRVFSQMKHASVVWPHSLPKDTSRAAALRVTTSALMNTSLHVQDELEEPADVPPLIEALAAVLGSEAAVRERKLYSVVYCTLAPLVHEGQMCDAYLDLSEFDAPIVIFPMPCTGSTGPGSLFSNIVLGNAEALSSLVLFQMARPGTPLVFGDASGSTEFSSGGFLEGSPEMVLQTAARGEMARFYGLPNTQAGCLTDAKEPGPQAVLEKMLTTLPLVLGGVDMVQGPGALETSGTLCLEQIVVDDEIAGLCQRVRDGVDMSDSKEYFADIESVGPGGHFLMQDTTLKACRSDEFYVPQLSDRNTFERWTELGKPDIYGKARERVEEILASPPENPLPDDIVGKFEEILQRVDAEQG